METVSLWIKNELKLTGRRPGDIVQQDRAFYGLDDETGQGIACPGSAGRENMV